MVAVASERPSTTSEVSRRTAGVAERLLESVVVVRGGWGSGSGVIWDAQGLVITNSHVVHGDDATVVLRDGRPRSAKLLMRDRERDLAALEVDRTGLSAVTPGDSTRVRVGQMVLAAGNPMGMRSVVTAGILTAIGSFGGETGGHLRNLIQADIALAPGSSGGPLADSEGRVLGINTMISSAGMALAVPTALVEQFLAFRQANRPYIGVEGLAVQLRIAGRERFALVLTAVVADSPAEHAGLLQGDILLALDGDEIQSGAQFQSGLRRRNPGDPLRLAILRASRPVELTVVPVEQVNV